MSRRSLQVPGSLSSALMMMYFGLGEVLGTKLHLRPVGNPAPPRPRNADAFTSSTICSGVISRALRNALKPSVARYVSSEAEFGTPNRLLTTRVSSGLG